MGLFGLFKPAWDSKIPEKRMNAVAEIKTDKAPGIQKLLKIAEKAEYEDVRQEAWKRLALEATGHEYEDIRLAAVRNIADEIFLAKVSLHDAAVSVRREAVKKVLHPQLLEKIARSEIDSIAEAETHYSATVMGKNLKMLNQLGFPTQDQVLNKIRGELHPDVRVLAVEKLDDVAVLAEVAVKDSVAKVSLTAMEKITDQGVLQKVAETHEKKDARIAAIEKISEAAFLQKVALEDEEYLVRLKAVNKISDQYFLFNAGLNDKNVNVRAAAINRICDQGILCEIAESDGNMKSTASERLAKLFLEEDSKAILPGTIQHIVNNRELRADSDLVRKKLLQVALDNPNIIKPFFPTIKKRYLPWHIDASHRDKQHTDRFDDAPGARSNDCVHVDNKEHTDSKHADHHEGKKYLAKFPPFFND